MSQEYTTDLEMQGVSSPAIDPAEWSINSLLVEHFILNQPRQDISKIDFNKTRRIYGKYLRHCLEIYSQESYIMDKHKFEIGYYILPQKMRYSVFIVFFFSKENLY